MSCALSKLLSPCVLSLLLTAYAIPASFASESTNVDPPTIRLWTNTRPYGLSRTTGRTKRGY
jgi:hypothetical protein